MNQPPGETPDSPPRLLVVFEGDVCVAEGDITEATAAAKRAHQSGTTAPVLVFDAEDGRVVDLDLREGDKADLPVTPDVAPATTKRGRPRLGVVSREVTLLPRHWDWLAGQRGGASAALRRLVEAAARKHPEADRKRARRDAAYRFMAAMAGDRPGFEEASRALFADDPARLAQHIDGWPCDIRRLILRLLG